MQMTKHKKTRSWVIRLEAERKSQHPFWLIGGKYNFRLCKLKANAARFASFPHRRWYNTQMCQMCSKSWRTMQQMLTLMSFFHSLEISCLFNTTKKTLVPKIKSYFYSQRNVFFHTLNCKKCYMGLDESFLPNTRDSTLLWHQTKIHNHAQPSTASAKGDTESRASASSCSLYISTASTHTVRLTFVHII